MCQSLSPSGLRKGALSSSSDTPRPACPTLTQLPACPSLCFFPTLDHGPRVGGLVECSLPGATALTWGLGEGLVVSTPLLLCTVPAPQSLPTRSWGCTEHRHSP